MSAHEELVRELTDEADRGTYEAGSFGHQLGFGERPAVAVVDLQVGYTDPARSPLASDLTDVIAASAEILEAARAVRVPVLFTVEAWDPDALALEGAMLRRKVPSIDLLATGSELVELDPRIQRMPGEPLIAKQRPSAFSGTTLDGMLSASGVDTLIVVGCSTSNCIRSTVSDALSHGFRPIVPVEAVGDRSPASHRASLVDIAMKYADLVRVSDVVKYLDKER